jgi:hypothetical protein
MSEKGIIFIQPAGIGDIFFLLHIADTLAKQGFNIKWPIAKNIKNIIKYLEIHENINFCDEKLIFGQEDFIINFSTADRLFSGSLLQAKYKLANDLGINVDFKNWSSSLRIKRDKEKEDYLFYNVLKLKDDDEYAFYNKNYGTPPDYKQKKNMKSSYKKIVDMFVSDNYTIFDWLKVVEKASEIHIVDSSLTYLIENLNIFAKDDNIHLYSRYTEERGTSNWFHAEKLFKKNWIYEEL